MHGGVTAQLVKQAVEKARKLAEINTEKCRKINVNPAIPTCLFFDEANTTEAVALVKEIMVDETMDGKALNLKQSNLYFIAAVNPYMKYIVFNCAFMLVYAVNVTLS